ncbi:MAG: sugar phosphate isomerase/epimerase family protein [Candidatus Scatosoma sp.]
MKLGIAKALAHNSAQEWAKKHVNSGLSAVVFPISCNAEKQKIIDYKRAADDYGLMIAEVGAWCNLLDRNPEKAKANLDYSMRTMEMADKIGAKCVVNISGSMSGEFWDGGAKENYSQETFDKVVEIIRQIISVSDKCPFSLEPMPWMIPYDADNYLAMIQAVNDDRFAVHMDAVNMICSPTKYFFQKEFLKDVFDKLGNRIVSAHIKDLKLSNRLTFRLEECAPLDGGFETAFYLQELEKLNSDMPVMIEHLEKDEEYLLAIEKIKRLCDKEDIIIK